MQETSQDFDIFYQRRSILTAAKDELVLSCDGKGIAMLKRHLRELTHKAAEASRNKVNTRLSKGEKSNRKCMATIGAVFDCAPASRTVEDIISNPEGDGINNKKRCQVTRNKWLTASARKDTA